MFTFPRRCEGPESGRGRGRGRDGDRNPETEPRKGETEQDRQKHGKTGSESRQRGTRQRGSRESEKAKDSYTEQDETQRWRPKKKTEVDRQTPREKEGGPRQSPQNEKWEEAEGSIPCLYHHPPMLKSKIKNRTLSQRCAG